MIIAHTCAQQAHQLESRTEYVYLEKTINRDYDIVRKFQAISIKKHFFSSIPTNLALKDNFSTNKQNKHQKNLPRKLR